MNASNPGSEVEQDIFRDMPAKARGTGIWRRCSISSGQPSICTDASGEAHLTDCENCNMLRDIIDRIWANREGLRQLAKGQKGPSSKETVAFVLNIRTYIKTKTNSHGFGKKVKGD